MALERGRERVGVREEEPSGNGMGNGRARRREVRWDWEPGGWVDGWMGGGRMAGVWGGAGEGRVRASGLPVKGRCLIELELRASSLRSREIDGRGLIEVELGLRRSPRGGDPGGPMWEVEMEEDALEGAGAGNEGEDAHLATAGGAQEGQHLVDAGQELGPAHASGS